MWHVWRKGKKGYKWKTERSRQIGHRFRKEYIIKMYLK